MAETRPAALWLWDTLCGDGARDAAAVGGAPGGDELSAIERLRSLQRADASGTPLSAEALLRRLGDCAVVAAGAVALRTLADELSGAELHRGLLQQLRRTRLGGGSDALTRAALHKLADTGAPRLALLPTCMALGGTPTVQACLADYYAKPKKAAPAATELVTLCALLMQPATPPLPVLRALLAAVAAVAATPAAADALLELACDAALHLRRRLRAADDTAPGSALRTLLEELAVCVLGRLPVRSLLTSSASVRVTRKVFSLLCGAGASANSAGLRLLLSQHWGAERTLLLLATVWSSPGRDSRHGGASHWRATRLNALQLTQAVLAAHARYELYIYIYMYP